MHASHLLVGTPPGDHALFSLNATCDIHAASVGYEFNTSIGDLSKTGARAVLSIMDAPKYHAIENISCTTGMCMANGLNNAQQSGDIRHLLLISKNEGTLAQISAAALPFGKPFHLTGHYLAFQEGTLNNTPFQGEIPGTGYFLVEVLHPQYPARYLRRPAAFVLSTKKRSSYS